METQAHAEDSNYISHQEREARIQLVYGFLEGSARVDGIVMSTPKDVVEYLTRLGRPAISHKTVWSYLRDLQQRGKLEVVPYSKDLEMPVLEDPHHPYRRRVLKLVAPAEQPVFIDSNSNLWVQTEKAYNDRLEVAREQLRAAEEVFRTQKKRAYEIRHQEFRALKLERDKKLQQL